MMLYARSPIGLVGTRTDGKQYNDFDAIDGTHVGLIFLFANKKRFPRRLAFVGIVITIPIIIVVYTHELCVHYKRPRPATRRRAVFCIFIYIRQPYRYMRSAVDILDILLYIIYIML